MKTVAKNMPDLFRVTREEWLESARLTARRLLKEKLAITIEDVLKECERPSYLHHNVTGSVFKTDIFKPIGFVPSKRAASHGRYVRLWRLTNYSKAISEQECEA